MAGSTAAPPLPSPGVSFPRDFLERVGRLVGRVAGEVDRREGAGRPALLGVGSEFVGHRPYRAGEDLRALDWSLFARLQRPFVRVSRREASERWAVLVDASASMGVGVPGKLQCAAELAVAIAALGLRAGAETELVLSDGRGQLVRRQADLMAAVAFLERARASGDDGLARLLAEPSRCRGAGRVFCVGDLFDVEPEHAFALASRGRSLVVAQVLAREELTPPADAAVEWVDAEDGTALTVRVDDAARARYERLLAERLEAWRAAAGRHRAVHACFASDVELESIVLLLDAG